MRRVLLATNVEKYLHMKATLKDISNMCVLTTREGRGNVPIVGKLFNTHVTSSAIYDRIQVIHLMCTGSYFAHSLN